MDIINKYKVEHVDGECTIILYVNSGSFREEFSSEVNKKEVNEEISEFIKKKFAFIGKKTVKIMIGTTLLASFTLAAATPSLAEETEGTIPTATETTETVTPAPVEDTDTTTPAPVEEAEGTTPVEETDTVEATEAPSLVPGDFFYFVKTMVEKVQLSLTFNDAEKAQKLANFASERIAEARVLIENGDSEGAADLLNKALETQELALSYTEEAGITPTTEGEPAVTEEQTNLSETRDAIKVKIGNNTLALLGALSHVKNPQAQASLMKNIQKSFDKMEKRLGKIEQIQNKKAGTQLQEEINNVMTETEEDTEDVNNAIDEATKHENTGAGAGIVVPPKVKKNAEKKQVKEEKKSEAKANKGQANK